MHRQLHTSIILFYLTRASPHRLRHSCANNTGLQQELMTRVENCPFPDPPSSCWSDGSKLALFQLFFDGFMAEIVYDEDWASLLYVEDDRDDIPDGQATHERGFPTFPLIDDPSDHKTANESSNATLVRVSAIFPDAGESFSTESATNSSRNIGLDAPNSRKPSSQYTSSTLPDKLAAQAGSSMSHHKLVTTCDESMINPRLRPSNECPSRSPR